MSGHGNTHLLEKLISDKLSKEELDEFLAGFKNLNDSQAYSDLLEAYFQELINQQAQDSPIDVDEKPLPATDHNDSQRMII